MSKSILYVKSHVLIISRLIWQSTMQ